jgi:predicted nucleic acid-binding protein
MKTWLIDTGPFIAYFDRSDPMHRPVASSLERFSGQLVTTGAVVTEVMYFLSDTHGGPVSFAELLLVSGIRIVELTQPADIVAAAELMSKYSDTPMDFADATLVLLAEELELTEILTLDRRGFTTYRTRKGKGFRLILQA